VRLSEGESLTPTRRRRGLDRDGKRQDEAGRDLTGREQIRCVETSWGDERRQNEEKERKRPQEDRTRISKTGGNERNKNRQKRTRYDGAIRDWTEEDRRQTRDDQKVFTVLTQCDNRRDRSRIDRTRVEGDSHETTRDETREVSRADRIASAVDIGRRRISLLSILCDRRVGRQGLHSQLEFAAAARLWGILRRRPAQTRTHVTVVWAVSLSSESNCI